MPSHWFNPLVWWAAWKIQVERERACDDLVVNSGIEATDYAEHLLRIASGFRSREVVDLAGLAMGVPSRLEGRLLALLSHQTNRQEVTRDVLAAVAVVALSVSLPLAVVGATSDGTFDKAASRGVSTETFDASFTAHPGSVMSTTRLKGRRSIAGSGHAVKFQRPGGGKYLMAIEIFASRYGYPQAPDEDFHVYLLDENQQLIQAYPFPYATIQRGEERWYTLSMPAVKVPRQFYVALSFNPHSTKGVYLGFDSNVQQSHSYTGRPTTGFQKSTGKPRLDGAGCSRPEARGAEPF